MLMGRGFLWEEDGNILNLDVVMITSSVNTIKATELYTLNGYISWYMNYI